jgi:chromosome segregation protein
LNQRLAQQREERASLALEHGGQTSIVESLEARVTEVQERNAALRQDVTRVRRADEEARSRETELTRELAALEAEAARGEARANEALERLTQLADEKRELDAETRRLDEQGDLFAEHTRTLKERRDLLLTQRQTLESGYEELKEAETEAKRVLSLAEEVAGRLIARVDALDRLERDFHGFAPAVAATLAARASLPGLVGPVADLVNLPAERGAELEAALGSLLQALVVEGEETPARIRAWIAEHQAARGTVALLPRHALPRLEALIEVLEFAGDAPGEPLLIGRHERLEALRAEAERAKRAVAAHTDERTRAGVRVGDAESAIRDILATLNDLELELRRAEADESTRGQQRGRVERALIDIARRQEELERMRQQGQLEASHARGRHAQVESRLTEHRVHWQSETGGLAEREAAWEAVRDEEAETRVSHARAEGSLQALERRMTLAAEEIDRMEQRLAALDGEEAEHRDTLAQIETTRTRAGAELELLFEQREALGIDVRVLDQRLADEAEAMASLEAQAREMRKASDQRSEVRLRLELQRAEAASSERSVRERMQAEWGRPYEQLLDEAEPVEGETHVLRADLDAVAADIERLGPINMLAMEEHAEESQRLEFLQTQRNDLVKARDDLQSAIRQINKTARELFNDTFEQIRAKFHITFQTLFEGGECDIRLESPDDPLETPIDIVASPRGKRTQRIHLLSGGERALTALALLFAIYLVKPSPFCVLDEVDAPLDEANIGRFIQMLEQFKVSTQFIVITHNPRTMESADWLYGVTMEEPGISSIVGVHLDEVLAGAAPVGS